MIFFYFFLVFLRVDAQDSCEVEEPTGGTTCSHGYTYFYRTPRPENQYTSGWCLRLIKQSEDLSQKDAELLCGQDEAQLSIFDNIMELSKLLDYKTYDYWIRFDGYRKDKCKNDQAIANDPDCRRGRAFYMKNNRTDPTVFLHTFADVDPNYAYKEPDVNAESCLTVKNGNLADISCNSGSPAGAIKGLVCGKLPH